MEALQSILTWRISSLPSLDAFPLTPFLRCLPPTAHDPFGRPIVLMRLAEFNGDLEDLKTIIIRNMELFRLHLERLNEQSREDVEFRPILQYVALLDIQCVSFSSMVSDLFVLFTTPASTNVQHNVELLTWYINELLPRFPGMLAAGTRTVSKMELRTPDAFDIAVFVLNYSWAHNGLWSIAKYVWRSTILAFLTHSVRQTNLADLGTLQGLLPYSGRAL